MVEDMNSFEVINTAIDSFTTLLRIKRAQPEGCANPELERELKTLEIKLHTFGVNTDSLKE